MNKETTVLQLEDEDLLKIKNFTFENLNLKTKEKVLLKEISGGLRQGELVAIMGGSGAGKSTLLNTLAGRIDDSTVLSGSILVDGHERHSSTWKSQCAYVEQDDLLFQNLTVYETLLYSARLRLPGSLSRKEKIERVDKVIAQLGLEGCRNTKIGSSLSRGISGGERKRVSIGVELVTDPEILFLDEPTSGLDAFNAFNVMETLKKLAQDQNKIILLSIHQPRTDILDLFDKIILLSEGELVWVGTTHDAIEHFHSLGYSIPPKTNPSDFFLDTATIDRRSPELYESSKSRIVKFVEAYKNLPKEHFDVVKHSRKHSHAKRHWPSTWIGEFLTLADRNLLNDWRDPAVLGASIGANLFIMTLMSVLFTNVQNNAAGVQNRLGAFFFLCINLTFSVVGPSVSKFPSQKAIIKRERAAGSYRSSSAFMAKFIGSLPLLYIGITLFVVPVYWTVGFQATASQFFTYYVICIVQVTVSNALGFVIGSIAPTQEIGQLITPLIIIVFMLFSGLLINLDSITVVLRWIQWISFITYSYKALGQNEFNSAITFNCDAGERCFTNGLAVVEQYSLGTPSLWACVGINLGFIGFYLILGMLVFNRTSAPLSKLK